MSSFLDLDFSSSEMFSNFPLIEIVTLPLPMIL